MSWENTLLGIFNCYAKFPTVQGMFHPVPASLAMLGGGKYNLYCNYSSFLSTVILCDPPCVNGVCVNGACTPCPAGRFGENCTGESHVIKLYS